MQQIQRQAETPPAVTPVEGFEQLHTLLEDSLPPDQLQVVERAYHLAERAHFGVSRASGEPYITHPLAVAMMLAQMHMDYRTVSAALMHDVLEDTDVSLDEIVSQTDEKIGTLVLGMSKITNLRSESRIEAQAANFRKMLLAVVDDVRVVLIKLADRLHNMQTIMALSPERRRRIAQETIDIYAPIAHRLGLNQMKEQLERLCFEALYPLRYRVLCQKMSKARGSRAARLDKIKQETLEVMSEVGIDVEIAGREKTLYSLYTKMRTKQLSFQEVSDIFGVRIICQTVDDCYRVLGRLHGLYRPVSNLFKDYIAIPKVNHYQSLHTVLVTTHGVSVEVQIRTRAMDRVAESGIAAHWMYKTGEIINGFESGVRNWLSEIADRGHDAANSEEFLNSVKQDLFPEENYVFSPLGKIYPLPQGGTVVDFAYAVHSDIGNACVAAKVDLHLVPLSYRLSSGQTVEIITGQDTKPHPMWLSFVVTPKARAAIRHYLRNLKSEEAIKFGRRLLDRALARHLKTLGDVPEARFASLMREFGFKTRDRLFLEVGLGQHIPSAIAARLLSSEQGVKVPEPATKTEVGPLVIDGADNAVLALAQCCKPLPGDPIHGLFSPPHGVMVHRAGCPVIRRSRRRSKEWLHVAWADECSGSYRVELEIELRNNIGAVARITSLLAGMQLNIEHLHIDAPAAVSTMSVIFGVQDRKHLARIMRRLRNLRVVEKIHRPMSKIT